MEQKEVEKQLIAAKGKLRLYAYSLTADWEKAEDLLQETFLRALCKADKLEDKGKFTSWARAIMHNTFVNIANREKRYQSIEQIYYTTPQPNSEEEEFYIDTKIEIDDICNAINTLPGNAGKVMQLYISGHKYLEISVMMNIPLGTVKTRINISRAILKRKLKDYMN